jgi:hypothetical protein
MQAEQSWIMNRHILNFICCELHDEISYTV